MNAVMEQAVFDLGLDDDGPQAFDTMQTPENGGKCSTCWKPLRGRYSRCSGRLNDEGWFAFCDRCVEAGWKS